MTRAFAHLTLPTRDVEATASFLERMFGFRRGAIPGNSPVPTQWLDMGDGQQIHVVYVDGFTASAFEGEFGRHIAITQPRATFAELGERLLREGAEVMPAIRPSAHGRFFVREPINGYVFEVIAGRGKRLREGKGQRAKGKGEGKGERKKARAKGKG